MNLGYHFDLIREAFLEKGFNKNSFAIKMALLANGYTDIFQEVKIELLFDDDFCVDAHVLVAPLHFDNLKDKHSIKKIFYFLLDSTRSALEQKRRNNDVVGALMVIGTSLHIQQDFYAHSNWAELNMDLYSDKNSPTYFDVDENTIDQAIRENNRLDRYTHFEYDFEKSAYENIDDNGLFTHCSLHGRPSHTDQLNKDFAGRPYFEWAYKGAVKGSVQWLAMAEEVCGRDFWRRIKNYTGNELDSKDDIEDFTRFDGGELFEILQMTGAWKSPDSRRSDWAIGTNYVADLEFFRAGSTPVLGNKWKDSVLSIAGSMFEDNEFGKLWFLGNQRNVAPYKTVARMLCLDTYWHDLFNHFDIRLPQPGNRNAPPISYYMDLVRERIKDLGFTRFTRGCADILLKRKGLNGIDDIDREFDDFSNNKLNTILSGQAANLVRTMVRNVNHDYKWFKLTIPHVKSYSCHEDNDLYVKIFIDGVMYREAEELDDDDPNPCWTVIKPVRDENRDIRIKIEFWEDDEWLTFGDDRMQFGSDEDLEMVYNPGRNTLSSRSVNAEDIRKSPNGWTVRASHGDDNKAFIKVGMISDHRVEFIMGVSPEKHSDTDDYVYADTGPYMFALNNLNEDDFQRGRKTLFAIDPGRRFSREMLPFFDIRKDGTDDVKLHSANMIYNNLSLARDNNIDQWYDESNKALAIHSNYHGATYVSIEDAESCLEYFTVKVFTGTDDGTDNKVALSFLDGNDNHICFSRDVHNSDGKFYFEDVCVLGNNSKDKLERRGSECFYFEPISLEPIKIKNINKIRVYSEGNDDWRMEKIEVWVNGKKLYSDFPRKLFKDSDTWTSDTILMPQRIFMDNDNLTAVSKGMKPVNAERSRAHFYEVTAQVSCLGYAQPDYRWTIEPENRNITCRTISSSPEGSKVKFSIPINHNWNPTYSYGIRVRVSQDGHELTDSARINLPRPGGFITESSFEGGQEIINQPEKHIHYDGLYKVTPENFGTRNLNIRWEYDEDVTENSCDDDVIGLGFNVPPRTRSYKVKAAISDDQNVQSAELEYIVHIPRLSMDLKFEYKDKSKTYYLKDYPYICNNLPDYDPDMVVREIYDKVVITAVPKYERDGEPFEGTVFSPKYTWKTLLAGAVFAEGESRNATLLDKYPLKNPFLKENNKKKSPSSKQVKISGKTLFNTIKLKSKKSKKTNDKKSDVKAVHVVNFGEIVRRVAGPMTKVALADSIVDIFNNDDKPYTFEIDLRELEEHKKLDLEVRVRDKIGQSGFVREEITRCPDDMVGELFDKVMRMVYAMIRNRYGGGRREPAGTPDSVMEEVIDARINPSDVLRRVAKNFDAVGKAHIRNILELRRIGIQKSRGNYFKSMASHSVKAMEVLQFAEKYLAKEKKKVTGK